MSQFRIESDFLRYLLAQGCTPGNRLPSLNQISNEIGISVGKLREQLEVARVLGLIEASPRRGIHYTGYNFLPAVRQSLMFGLGLDRHLFDAFSALRGHLEIAFWEEAVNRLTDEDRGRLRCLVALAWEKLQQERIQIPHAEHRAFHMTIFQRLDNLFVTGLLEAYWDAYEAIELNTYADYRYLTAVWRYHEQIAEAIGQGALAEARQLHVAHMQLLGSRGAPFDNAIATPLPDGTILAAGE
ncbi:MAG: FadR family transcriptional regulator [Caldilineaceae bacterium]|nr:FadR family transcriptional regulator [Caldilineaceae bacterium]